MIWLGSNSPRNDKVLSQSEVTDFLASTIVVEEKLDGANLGFSLSNDGSLVAQNRGQYLTLPYSGQFSKLSSWLDVHADTLQSVLTPDLIVFGEWCAALHTLDYQELPDWFLVFDVYDRSVERFWSTSRRNELAKLAGLKVVPQISHGKFDVSNLKKIVSAQQSLYRRGPIEGIVIRNESELWCLARAKIVRSDFTQTIDNHWRSKLIKWNRIKY